MIIGVLIDLALPLADFLPRTLGPYVTLMMVGFGVAICGHIFRWRLAVAAGILMIFAATVVFPLAINLSQETPAEVRQRR